MSVLAQLGVAGPMPNDLNAPALPDQAQQGLWGGADAGEEPMPRRCALQLSCRRCGDHHHNPGAARPVGLDVLRCLLPPCRSSRLGPGVPSWCHARGVSPDRLQ